MKIRFATSALCVLSLAVTGLAFAVSDAAPGRGEAGSAEARFDKETEGWKIYSNGAHRVRGGVDDSGYVQASRPLPSPVLFDADMKSSNGGLAGNLAGLASDSQPWLQLQAYTKDFTPGDMGFIGQPVGFFISSSTDPARYWAHTAAGFVAAEWSSAQVRFNINWTDDEAKKAGWTPSAGADSFAKTIRGVVRLRIQVGADKFGNGKPERVAGLDQVSCTPAPTKPGAK